MKKLILSTLALALALFAVPSENWAQPKLDAQIYELRTYTTHEGSLPKLHARFRDHTNHIFVKHGMKLIAYWVPAAEDNKLIYVLAFPSVEAREKSWQAFRDDPEWQAAYKASRADGPIVEKVESVIMFPTDYSPIR